MSDIQTKNSNFAEALSAHAHGGRVERNFGRYKKIFIIVLIVFFSLSLVAALFGFIIARQVIAMKGQVNEIKIVGKEAYEALKTQNLPLANQKLSEVTTKLKDLQTSVAKYKWTTIVPFVGSYYADVDHAFAAGFVGINAAQRAIKEVEPYADVLGFKGQGSFTGGSAEERIGKILETLSKVTPALDAIGKDLQEMNLQLAAIDENRYPVSLRGTPIRSRITEAKALTQGSAQALLEKRSAIEALPEVAGAKTRKKYLVLFQNSGELRPTGGFLTAYAIINVDKGKVEAEGSGDIYDLDVRFKDKPVIPAILKKFLTSESRWNLRDMNLSPDFVVSMKMFNDNYQKIKGQTTKLDGIIAVDTHFLESLLSVTGPVEVAGYGTFSAENDKRCDCPQIIYALSEIIDRPTPFLRENRKGILGPMMKSVLNKAYTTPKNKWPELFETGWKDIEAKHIQFYFFDEKLQAAAESIGAAGRVLLTPEGSDYFFIVDTNLAGAKSNFFVNSEVAHAIDPPANGRIKHAVTVAYKNPFKASNCNLEAGQLCLNGVLQDWVRVYLPKGSKIESTRGFDEGSSKESEELDHHMLEGTFRLAPLGQAKLEFTYTVPYTDTKNYNLFVQKQGGTENWKYTFDVNGQDHTETLDKDKKLVFPW